MNPSDLVKEDYLEEYAKLGYTPPTEMDINKFHAWMFPRYKKQIQEERLSAERQGVIDPCLNGKTDAEILKERLSGPAMWPGDEIVQPLVHEVRRNAKLLNLSFPMPFYCGPIPILSFNASAKRTTHGAVIFVYDELPIFIYNVLKVYVLSTPITVHSSYDEAEDEATMVEPSLSQEDAAATLAQLVANFLRFDTSGPPPFDAQGGAVSDVAIDLSLSTIRFVIGHECGHILGGHLSQRRSTMSPIQQELTKQLQGPDKKRFNAMFSETFTKNDAYKLAKSWDDEKQADQYGMDLCLAPAWPMNNTIERFHDAATRLAGPFIFFALDDFITSVVLHQFGIDLLDVLGDHPPSAERAKIMRGWIYQISANAEILLQEGGLFAKWLEGMANEVYEQWR